MRTNEGVFDINLSAGPAEMGNEFLTLLDELREYDPVYWNKTANCWMITRHQDVADAFNYKYPALSCKGRLVSSVMSRIPPDERSKKFPVLSKYLPLVIVDTEAPEHTRLRKLLMKAVTKKAVEQIRPIVREKVRELLRKAVDSPEIEFQEQISRPLPGFVIFKMLGIPEEQFANMREWSNAIMEVTSSIGSTEKQITRAEKCASEMNELGRIEREKRLLEPKDDLITALAQASDEGEKITEDEFFAQMLILIVAGHESTSSTITMIVEALSRHPEAWQYIEECPDKITDIVNEFMRYVCMNAGQLRVASYDFEWHGKQIKAGDMVMLCVAAANRDPRVYDNPLGLDFSRDNTNSMVFAPGVHHCVGHMLAKMEVGEFLLAMVKRFKGVDVQDDKLNFMPMAFFRGLYELNVRFHPR